MTWITVWEFFQGIDTKQPVSKEKWNSLYDLLNDLWRDERKDATPEELAAHAGAIAAIGRLTN